MIYSLSSWTGTPNRKITQECGLKHSHYTDKVLKYWLAWLCFHAMEGSGAGSSIFINNSGFNFINCPMKSN